MNTFQKHGSGILSLLLLLACSQEPKENKNESRQDNTLIITNAWARPAAEGTNSAAYMVIHNHTSRPDTLAGISSDAVTIAEVHESYEEEGMMGMRPAGTPVVKPGSRLELKPGGFHIMLMQVKQQLISGDSLQLNLQFTEAGTREVTAVVQ